MLTRTTTIPNITVRRARVPSARTALLKKHNSIHNSQQINLLCFLYKLQQFKQEARGHRTTREWALRRRRPAAAPRVSPARAPRFLRKRF